MRTSPLLSRPFLLCFGANLAQGLGFNLYLHLAGFLAEHRASEVQIGWIMGVSGLAGLLLRPSLGRILDGRGRRAVILVGALVNCVVCVLYLTVASIGPWIYAVRIGHGLAEAMLFTGLFTYAADYVPAERRNEGLALFGVSGMLPIGLGGLIGDGILALASYRALFAASAGFAVAALVLAVPLRDHPGLREGGEPPRGFLQAARQSDLLPLWFVGLAFAVPLTGVFTFLKRFVDETGLGSVGLFFSMYSGAAIVLRISAGWLPDRVGPRRVLFPSLGALAAGFAALSLARSDLAVAAAGLLCGIGHGFVFPILFGLVVTRAREAERGAAMSLYTGLFDAGWLVGGPVLGTVATGQRFDQMFLAAAGIVVGGGILFALWEWRVPGAGGRAAASGVSSGGPRSPGSGGETG